MLRVLMVGCGDVALRVARELHGRARLYGLSRQPAQSAALRTAGVVPIAGDLDRRETLSRLRTAPFALLHFAPPPAEGTDDPRTGHLLAALAKARMLPRRMVYISTTGVYGDCAGERVTESRKLQPATARARRRVAAEQRLRKWARANRVQLSILRAPGIYAETRLPLERLRRGTPALRDEDDVYTNHVHADDLARATVAAMFRGRPSRAYNASGDGEMKMGEWFDAVADAFGVPRPARIARGEAQQAIAPMLLSFMSESRRLSNARLKRELRLRLGHPTPAAMLATLARRQPVQQLDLPI